RAEGPALPRRVRRHRRAARRQLELRFVDGGLEQLDRIPGRVLDEDLLAADAGHDLVTEAGAGVTELRDQRLDVLDLELEAVPATGLRHPPVRHRLPAAARSARRAQHEAEVAAGEH